MKAYEGELTMTDQQAKPNQYAMNNRHTLTIVFRGLMIFHEDKKAKQMEIGVLREETQHVPRLLTITNGVLERVLDLRKFLDPADPRVWTIAVKNPLTSVIKIREKSSGKFDRIKAGPDPAFDDDFRWIMDLEGEDFYNRDLTSDLQHLDLLFPLMNLCQGEFYTRLKSTVLARKPAPKPFGSVAAVIGCDIPYQTVGASPGKPEVIAELNRDGGTIFSFEHRPNTIYEITNTPPDVLLDGDEPVHHHSDTTGTSDDHFHHYYSLFGPKPSPIFEFAADADPDPEPTLCGVGRLGTRKDSLGSVPNDLQQTP
jgi:hypothetical protein